MLAISRMKCLIMSPVRLSSFHNSHLPQTTPFALLSLTCKHISRNPLALFQNPNVLHQKPIISFPHISACSTHNRASKIEAASGIQSGEIHVIVGPMFAGKSTTLLRRIQSEKSNGRLKRYYHLDITSFPGQFAVNNFQLDNTLKDLCFSGRLNEAIRLLLRTGLPVQPGTYALLLQECIFRKEYMKGRRIHAQMIVVGFVLDEYLKTKLLILYAKSGDLSTAHILLEKFLEKSLVSWNALIACYVQKGLEAVGLSLYYEMRQGGMLPNSYTFASVFTACATLAILEHGKQAHALMIKCPIKENVIVNSALVDMYFKCSSLSDGHQAFDASQCRNVISWTALITGYGQHGRVLEVLDSFSRMKAEGYRPNYVTFLSVLSACSHGGLIDEGWQYFSSMTRDYGVQPKVQHYAAMVDLLGRAGRLHEAYEFLMRCPCQDHPVIWGALLGASRIHGDMDLAKLAADRYVELEPDNAGKYVVLSNAYATFGLWDGVAKVRAIMRDLGVTKEPSYSRIEVQGKIHFLHKGDESHRQSKEIREMVNTITCMVKDVEYVPDIDDLGDC